MLTVKGKYNTARIMTNCEVDEATLEQVRTMCNLKSLQESNIVIMPDCHAGAGCTIGTTMTIHDAVIPNFVGVDIGCGVRAVQIAGDVDLEKLDRVIREKIPCGFAVHNEPDDSNNEGDYASALYMNYFQAPNAPRLFRIHVHGDFYSVDYFSMWVRIAKANPTTTFLAFTKQYDIIKNQINYLPDNFSLVWSAWPGIPIPEDVREALPVAWMQDGTENRIPADATLCVGSCQACHAKCWTLKHQDVVFEKH